MRHIMHRFSSHGTNFRKESRRQIRMLIIVTLGFTIAFTWRQTIFDISEHIVSLITHVQNTTSLSILASTFITVFSLAVIYLAAHFLKEE